MAQLMLLGVLLLASLCGRFRASPSGESSRRGWSRLDALGSRYAAPGVSFSGAWSQAGSRAVSPLQPVSVQCQEANMVVTVQRDLFGTGKLVQASDLRLGASFCVYTSLSADNAVTFQTPLQGCGNTVQVTPDSLIYSSILTYNPTLSSNRVITRTNPTSVPILCIYPRNVNVSSNAIKPTWIPFSSTLSAEETLSFSLRLMSADWSSARTSTTFQLGDVFNIEASVQTGNSQDLRVFVDSCVATLSPDKSSSPRYELIASNGCLVDGKLSDSSSAFVLPRYQIDHLRFTVDAFRFIEEPRSLIYITCDMKAVPALQTADSLNKACSYSKLSNGWFPVEGSSAICSCCDALNCGTLVKRSAHFLPAVSTDQVAVLGPLMVLQPDHPRGPLEFDTGVHGADGEQSWRILGLVLAVSAVALSLVILGAVAVYKRSRALVNVLCN